MAVPILFKNWAIVRPSPVSNFSINDSGQCLTNNLFAFSNSSTVAYGSNSV